jgi:hypothetical protein
MEGEFQVQDITHCVPFATTNGNRNSVYQSLFFSPLRKERGNKPYLLAGLCNSCSFYNAMVQQKAQQRHHDNQDLLVMFSSIKKNPRPSPNYSSRIWSCGEAFLQLHLRTFYLHLGGQGM